MGVWYWMIVSRHSSDDLLPPLTGFEAASLWNIPAVIPGIEDSGKGRLPIKGLLIGTLFIKKYQCWGTPWKFPIRGVGWRRSSSNDPLLKIGCWKNPLTMSMILNTSAPPRPLPSCRGSGYACSTSDSRGFTFRRSTMKRASFLGASKPGRMALQLGNFPQEIPSPRVPELTISGRFTREKLW